MYEQVEKTQVKKSQMAANAVSQRRNSNAPTSRFVDNRPEAIQMRRLRELAKDSQQNAKLRELHNLAAANPVVQKKRNEKRSFGFVDNKKNNITQLKFNNHNNRGDQVGQLKANQSLQEIRALPLIQLTKKWENGELTEIDNEPEDTKQYLKCRIRGEVNDTVYVHQNSMDDFPYYEYVESSDTEEEEYEAKSDDEQEHELITVKQIDPSESNLVNEPTVREGLANTWDEGHFQGMGLKDKLTNVTLQRPNPGGTHYEVMCLVGGVHVKLHLTNKGYKLIYGADPSHNEDYFQDSKPESVHGKTGADLYNAFLSIAQQNGKYHIEKNDCERFADDLVNKIKDEVGDDFM